MAETKGQGKRTNRRQKGHQKGLWTERWAILWCMLKGYRLLAHRFPSPHGEVDLIFKRGKTVVFMEVKNRSSLRAAMESLTPHQQRRIIAGAQDFLRRHPYFSGAACRFDLFLMVGFRHTHIQDAWRPSSR